MPAKKTMKRNCMTHYIRGGGFHGYKPYASRVNQDARTQLNRLRKAKKEAESDAGEKGC